MNRLPWFPDWRGRAVAIIASGPSAKADDVSSLQGRLPLLAIKESWRLCSPPDVVYGCDPAWWRHNDGLRKLDFLKISYAADLAQRYPAIKIVQIKMHDHDILLNEPGVIGSGLNSGFQALNLAVQFGANRILLIGYDMDDRSGKHWYGRNLWPMANNPIGDNFERWIGHYSTAAKTLEKLGIDVVNASPISALKCFRRDLIAATLRDWGV